MKFSIIIPTNNRASNIANVLAALSNQTDKDFELVVVDDRSTDNTFEEVRKVDLPIIYIRLPERGQGWNASIPRNIGARIATGDILWFLDSDVLLPPNAVQATKTAFMSGKYARVLIGSYHWLKGQNITPSDVVERFDMIVANELPEKKFNHQIQNTRDLRQVSFDKATSSADEFLSFTDGLACFGGYLLLPKKIFLMSGGYDENIGAGCEDGDFGITLFEMKIPVSYLKEVCGYHIPHDWPQERNPQTIQENVKKLDKKHHVDLIHQSGLAYREWGIDWEPPPEFYNFDKSILKRWKQDWKHDRIDLKLKVNKV